MKVVYDYTESKQVIKEAWDIAIQHLQTTLGDQYYYNNTKDVLGDFIDKVEQDIVFKKHCKVCSNVDIEGNFLYSGVHKQEVCYDCYSKSGEF